MADAAEMMQSIIDSQGGAESGSPSSSPGSAPAPNPPDAPASMPVSANPQQAGVSEGAGVDESQDDDKWYDELLAEDDSDPFSALLIDDDGWSALQQNPQGLLEWAGRARGHIQQSSQREEESKALEADYEHFGGRANSGRASRMMGDFFRGDDPLSEEERARFGANGPRTYAERALHGLLSDKETSRVAGDIGVAILNMMPGFLRANEDYLLARLGFDPKFKEDYRNVAQSGGYKPQPDQEKVLEYFKTHQIPLEWMKSFNRLPLETQLDLLEGKPGATKFHLERYHKDFDREDREARDEQVAAERREQEVTQQTTRDLAQTTSKMFEKFVKIGVDAGLDPLRAHGAAAIAYKAIETGYWEEGSESNKLFESWFGQIKDGNKFQSGLSEKAYERLFMAEYRKALGQYKPQRSKPPVPANPGAPRPVTPPNGNQQPQHEPSVPPEERGYIPPDERMREIMRSYGANV